jgi:hypothetical protein
LVFAVFLLSKAISKIECKAKPDDARGFGTRKNPSVSRGPPPDNAERIRKNRIPSTRVEWHKRRVLGLRSVSHFPPAKIGVEELQSAIAQLPAEELDRFSRWFEEFLADQWDQRIEADILAGHLEAAGRRADDDFEAGRCTPLPP